MDSPEILDQVRKLWILDLIVQLGSFQGAASQAKITRSAVSQTVSQLESIFRRVLLVRERGGIRPTPPCLELLAKARPIFDSLEALRPTAEGPPPMSWLELGAFESAAIDVVPRLIVRLRAKIPGIRVTTKVARSGKLGSMVRKGELCMAVITELDSTQGLTTLPVAEDRLGLYASSRLPPRDRNAAVIARMGYGTLFADKEGHPRYYTRFLQALALGRQPALTSDSVEALVAATVEGAVTAILPERAALRRPGELTEVTPSAVRLASPGRHAICLVSRRNCDPRENDFLAAELRELFDRRRVSSPSRAASP